MVEWLHFLPLDRSFVSALLQFRFLLREGSRGGQCHGGRTEAFDCSLGYQTLGFMDQHHTSYQFLAFPCFERERGQKQDGRRSLPSSSDERALPIHSNVGLVSPRNPKFEMNRPDPTRQDQSLWLDSASPCRCQRRNIVFAVRFPALLYIPSLVWEATNLSPITPGHSRCRLRLAVRHQD